MVAIAAIALAITRLGCVAKLLVGASTCAHDAGAAGIAAYALVSTLAAVAFVPQLAFAVPAGFSYGFPVGFAIAYAVTFSSAMIAFALGRGLLRAPLAHRFRGDPRVARIDAAVRARGVLVVVLVRLSPMFPFAAVNYVLSVTRVSWRQYVAGTALGILPITALYVYLGSIADDAVAALRGDRVEAWHVAIAIAVAVAVSVALARLARRACRA